MRIGFGGYRISIRSKVHKEALAKALKEGCSLIDTSANYTNGESELLVGEVLKETGANPLIVTKAGYIQGDNLEVLEDLLKSNSALEFCDFGEHLKHSMDPVFLENQISASLERLGLESVEAVLIHNPEYFLKKNPGKKEEYYQRIERAFRFLKEEALKGRIRFFGVSSNTLVNSREEEDATDLERLWKAAENAGAEKYFKYIQFPMNLLEMNALQRQYEGKNLVERAKELGLVTMANRPFNAFTSSGLLRLATYPVDENSLKNPDEIFERHIRGLRDAWKEQRESEDEKLEDVPLFLQIKNIWHGQSSADAVEQVFFAHFFPFVARVSGRDLSPEESRPFYKLYETALEFAKKNMNERAEKFLAQAEEKGLIEKSEGTLTNRVVGKYAQTDVDYVLAGMKNKDYVEDLKKYF